MTPLVPQRVARVVAFAVLANFSLLFWMGMVEPWQPGRALAALAVAVAALLAPRAALPAVVLAAFVAGGVGVADLWPGRWGAVAGSISDGLDAVFGARIPYEGADPDLRLVLVLGGALGATAAGLLARRHRVASLIALVALFGVPAVATRTGLAAGAALALCVVLYLSAERVTQAELPLAGLVAGAAALLALAAAPALDTERPWFDYEEFAQQTASSRTVTFRWDHDYARLPWSRDGREMLRVQSPRRAYWKVDALDLFDGRRWLENPTRGAAPGPAAGIVDVSPANRRRWSFDISVSVRNLRSPTLALAGVTAGVDMPGRQPQLVGPGVWSAGREIRRGDSYRATVYVPEPSRAQLEASPAQYPVPIIADLPFELIRADGQPVEALTRSFGDKPLLVSYGARSAARALRGSDLSRTYALSRRLLRGAPTAYAYLRRIESYLDDGFRYDETPPRAARTLDGFLFDARAGFCQQFSGAMALLLRMGGVPARVATGFAPGSFDDRTKRYVVRDLDAHSWVEAWFPRIGWVVFDPTPAAAPPRSQALRGGASAGTGDPRDQGTKALTAPPVEKDGGLPWSTLLLAALGVLALAVAGRLLWLRRGQHPSESELERALRGAGEAWAPSLTLMALEARLPSSYLGALRAQRYAGGPPPTRAHRRDLRRALSAGRSPLRRLRIAAALRRRASAG